MREDLIGELVLVIMLMTAGYFIGRSIEGLVHIYRESKKVKK